MLYPFFFLSIRKKHNKRTVEGDLSNCGASENMIGKIILVIDCTLRIGGYSVTRARGVQDWSSNVSYGKSFKQIINRCIAKNGVAAIRRFLMETVSLQAHQ
jgi:hypothetical protein